MTYHLFQHLKLSPLSRPRWRWPRSVSGTDYLIITSCVKVPLYFILNSFFQKWKLGKEKRFKKCEASSFFWFKIDFSRRWMANESGLGARAAKGCAPLTDRSMGHCDEAEKTTTTTTGTARKRVIKHRPKCWASAMCILPLLFSF